LTATITPTSTGPFGSATLTVTSNTPGSYTAQVTGTSGSIFHTTTVTVTVTSSGVGIVCIVSSSTTSCPATPAILAGTQGTQLRVSVFIQGSSSLNGFDITLLADHNVFCRNASGVSLYMAHLAQQTRTLLSWLQSARWASLHFLRLPVFCSLPSTTSQEQLQVRL
jgi:hypothetical protein